MVVHLTVNQRVAGSSPAVPAKFGTVAQLVAQETFNLLVVGSSPTSLTKCTASLYAVAGSASVS